MSQAKGCPDAYSVLVIGSLEDMIDYSYKGEGLSCLLTYLLTFRTHAPTHDCDEWLTRSLTMPSITHGNQHMTKSLCIQQPLGEGFHLCQINVLVRPWQIDGVVTYDSKGITFYVLLCHGFFVVSFYSYKIEGRLSITEQHILYRSKTKETYIILHDE